MKSMTRWLMTLALCTGLSTASAETQPEQDYRGGTISYINLSTLEIGIDDTLFKLDGAFQIHGLGDGDRVLLMRTLQPGMYVRYRTATPGADQPGQIEEILIPAN